jgi:RNA polymerase sigma-70 factor (ECF subfamily)
MDRWRLPRDPILALREGDPEPFERFVRTHARTLIAFFRQRGAAVSRAEDLAQDVFLKLYRGAQRYQPEERFGAYVFRVARNAWVDDCRRRGVRPEPVPGDGEPEREPDPGPGPGAELAAGEEEERVRRVLATLPETHRAVVELAVLGELDYASIAAVLGIPEGTVKSRMFYAVRRLRAHYEAGRGAEGVA